MTEGHSQDKSQDKDKWFSSRVGGGAVARRGKQDGWGSGKNDDWGSGAGGEWSKKARLGSSWQSTSASSSSGSQSWSTQKSWDKEWSDKGESNGMQNGSHGQKNDGSPNSEENTGCGDAKMGDAKMRLVRLRKRLETGAEQALESALKRKRDQWWSLNELPLALDVISDMKLVFEQDTWKGQPSGTEWLKEWLKDGADWAQHLEEDGAKNKGQEFYCRMCWQACSSSDEYTKHCRMDKHRKRHETWTWRYGMLPDKMPEESSDARAPVSSPSPGRKKEKDDDNVTLPGATKAVSELMKKTREKQKSPVAAAKRRLLEYRDALTAAQRLEILDKIGLSRANDVKDLKELMSHFDDEIAKQLQQVSAEDPDMKWTCTEPTFSWLSGFYWHTEATQLEQQGQQHSSTFCHLCEAEFQSEEEMQHHLITKRHAENSWQWVQQMGTMEHPSHCGRCPASSSSSSGKDQRWNDWGKRWEMDLDLEYRRSPSIPEPQVKPEDRPPSGFTSIYQGDRGRVLATSYAAVAVTVHSGAHAVRLISTLPIGPKEKVEGNRGRKQNKRRYIDLNWCKHSGAWTSLAIPLTKTVRGDFVDFTVAVRWEASEKSIFEELDEPLRVQVPRAGEIAVLHADLQESRASVWVECKPILDFVGRGQVKALGGVERLRGTQHPVQFATEDVMLTFLFWVPQSEETAPLLLYFHGDLPRGAENCPQPGLADFAHTYGPADIVTNTTQAKKRSHTVRDFVVITPVCNEETWWLRYPAAHDATNYAESNERCLRGMIDMVYDLGLCRREAGACFAGQSMGGYMALEMARAMPEGTAAVFAGAPCFDACRLNDLAQRLVNVPLWLLIGRNDTLCSFEEVASLALMMRDLDAKCVRLTSAGIKGHAEVGPKLEKPELFEWLRNPLG